MKIFKIVAFVVSSVFISNMGHAVTRLVSPQGDPLANGIQSPTTLEQALQIARDGDVIALEDGIYPVMNTLYITQGIRLTGLGGRPNVVISCLTTGNCLSVDIVGQAPLVIDGLVLDTPAQQSQTALSIRFSGVVYLHNLSFNGFETGIQTLGTQTLLEVNRSRFHQIGRVGIDVSDGSYLKRVFGCKFYSVPVNTYIFTSGILYAASNNVMAQHLSYKTSIQSNTFTGFSFAGVYLEGAYGKLDVDIKQNTFDHFSNPPWQDAVETPAHALWIKSGRYLAEHHASIKSNTFEFIEGTAVFLDLNAGIMAGEIERNTIKNTGYGIYALGGLGTSQSPLFIRNNFIKDYVARSSIIWGEAPGLGIHVQPTSEPNVIVSYNTVIGTGNETMPMVPGSAVHIYHPLGNGLIKIVNNLLHTDGYQFGNYGMHFEGALQQVPAGIVFDANNVDGFNHNGRVTNFIITHYSAEYDVPDIFNNTEYQPSFVAGLYDLQNALPADAALDWVALDIEGPRVGTPDVGAYQH